MVASQFKDSPNMFRNKSPKYSLVVPVYNSQHTLRRLKCQIIDAFEMLGAEFEVIFVDDCSTDGSWSVLHEFTKGEVRIRLIRLSHNVGQWVATMCGMSKALGDYIATMDDDLEYDARDIIGLIRYLESHDVDIVYGIPDGKAKKDISNQLFYNMRNKFVNTLLDKQVTESFKVLKRQVLFGNDREVCPTMHFEAYAKFAVSEHRVATVPVSYRADLGVKSRHGFWKKLKIISRFSWEYWINPFRPVIYLGVVLLCSCVVGLVLQTPVQRVTGFSNGLLWGGALVCLLFGLLFVVLGSVGGHLAKLLLRQKGLPNYVIIAEQ